MQPTTSRQKTPLIVLLLLLQWPLSAAALALLSPQCTEPGIDAMALVLCLAAFLGIASWRSPSSGWYIFLPLIALTAGSLLALRSVPITVSVLVAALAWLLAGAYLHLADRRTAALIARQTALVLLAGFLTELIAVAVIGHTGDFRYRVEHNEAGLTVLLPHPVRTYALFPGANYRHARDNLFTVTYHVDLDGHRRVPGRPATGPRVLMEGCSFTFGWGLEDEDTIPAQLQKLHPDVRIENRGVPSYGCCDVYLDIQEALEAPDVPSLCIYNFLDDHFYRLASSFGHIVHDSVAADRPCFHRADGDWVHEGKVRDQYLTPTRKLEVNFVRRSHVLTRVAAPRELTPECRELAAAMVCKMKEACDRRHCRFLCVRLPEVRVQPKEDEIKEWLRDLASRGVTVLDYHDRFRAYLESQGRPASDFFFARDDHPTPPCARMFSEWLDEDLRKLLPTPAPGK